MFWLKSAGSIVLLSGIALTAFLFFQRKLLYFPDTRPPSKLFVSQQYLELWPADGDRYRGLVTLPSLPSAHGTIVLFHGNAGAAIDRASYLGTFIRRNFRVILAEYPGYGGRPGRPSEKTLVEDARQTLRLAHQAFGSPLYVWGESLGAGVSAAAVADPSLTVDGLVLLTPWDTLANVAQTHYPFLPKALLLDTFDSIKNLRDFKSPIAVLISELDEVIPQERGWALYQALPEKKRAWLFPGAKHSNWPSSPRERWWNEVFTFLGPTTFKPPSPSTTPVAPHADPNP